MFTLDVPVIYIVKSQKYFRRNVGQIPKGWQATIEKLYRYLFGMFENDVLDIKTSGTLTMLILCGSEIKKILDRRSTVAT